MGYTSTAVKARYNKKTYKQFNAPLRIEEFEKIETEREKLGMSRAEFLKFLHNYYTENKKRH